MCLFYYIQNERGHEISAVILIQKIVHGHKDSKQQPK